jgi:hypothetical protein
MSGVVSFVTGRGRYLASRVPKDSTRTSNLTLPSSTRLRHRFNAISSSTCGHYAIPFTWTPVEGGGFNCDICAGRRELPTISEGLGAAGHTCGNPTCSNTSNNYNGHFRYIKGTEGQNDDPDLLRCTICFQYLSKGKGDGKAFPKFREYGNPACDRTNGNWQGEFLTFSSGKDAYRRDLDLIRCRTCYSYYSRQY